MFKIHGILNCITKLSFIFVGVKIQKSKWTTQFIYELWENSLWENHIRNQNQNGNITTEREKGWGLRILFSLIEISNYKLEIFFTLCLSLSNFFILITILNWWRVLFILVASSSQWWIVWRRWKDTCSIKCLLYLLEKWVG